jgi:signal transduction histidine kinase/CheY-like chemotaxis protein
MRIADHLADSSLPSPPATRVMPAETAVAQAQIEALFGTVTQGVAAAAVAAIILVAALYRQHFVTLAHGLGFLAYMLPWAAAHAVLAQAHRRRRDMTSDWRPWAYAMTFIAFAEGTGWGWATVALTNTDSNDVNFIVLFVSQAVAAGSVPAFGAYMPAFLALFIPVTLPYTVAALMSHDPVQHIVFSLMIVFIAGVGGIGVTVSQSIRRLIRLRLDMQQLAGELLVQKELAEQANLAKSNFLAAASHDLRQPIHALGLFVGALRGVAMAPEGERLIGQIEQSAAAMDGLFSALLDISKLDAGAVEVRPETFEIGALLARICGDFGAEANAKGLRLSALPCTLTVESDPVLLERILRNLVANAVRYTATGRVLAGCRRRGDTLAVQVWDTGRGIPDAEQERIFGEYYQLGNPERDRTKGLGLGLAIVRRLATLMDCPVQVCSVPGRGSCFEIRVPCARGEMSAAETSAPEAAPPTRGAKMIVVIDDERAIREAMTEQLRFWGHEVVTAAGADEAIAMLSAYRGRPDLIICDYRLRGEEDGIEAVARLRADYNETIPAMLITGDTAPDRLREAHASDLTLLHKPVSSAKLKRAIAELTA